MVDIELPLVTIIIPCYNHEKFIVDCLNSIKAQTYSNIQIIICDDASTDLSWDIINTYMKEENQYFNDITISRNTENMGIVRTLNKMMQLASGKYIKLIASDDMLTPNCISVFVNKFEVKNNIDVLVSNGFVIPEETNYPVMNAKEVLYAENPNLSKETLFQRLYMGNFIFAPGVMMKKEIYDIYGYYDESIKIEDWEFWLKLSLTEKVDFDFINQNLVFYRKNNSSISSTAYNEKLEQRRILIHESEMKILEKYGKEVGVKIYANKKLQTILTERAIGKTHQLKTLTWITQKELKEFKLWKYISWRIKVRVIKTIVKENLLLSKKKEKNK